MTQPPPDIVFRNAQVEGYPAPLDIAIDEGRIVAIQSGFTHQGKREIDASGLMASPPFIDPHQHLDCAFLDQFVNQSGTLEEAIEINSRTKSQRSHAELYDKACGALEQSLLHGTGWMRSHGDVDSVSGLKLMVPVLEAKETFRDLVEVQFVVFPQLGLVRDPKSVEYMWAAMREGADVVGGIPHAEGSREDAERHIAICFEVAKHFDADIDMHVDETDDPRSRTLELLAEATIRENYQGRVTAGHCCALAAYEQDYTQRVIEKVAAAEMHVVTNPMVNLHLQGRGDPQPVRRGITRVKALLQAGVNVSCGLDDVRNIFFPFGKMDMLEVAMVTALTAHMSSPEAIQTAFDMPRERAARVLGLSDYGLRVGGPADLVFFAARDAQDALRLQPLRRFVVRAGEVVVEQEAQVRMDLPA